MSERWLRNPGYRRLIRLLVKARKQAGLTQTDAGMAAKIDQSQISKYERGEREIGVMELIRICNACNVDPGRLMQSARLTSTRKKLLKRTIGR